MTLNTDELKIKIAINLIDGDKILLTSESILVGLTSNSIDSDGDKTTMLSASLNVATFQNDSAIGLDVSSPLLGISAFLEKYGFFYIEERISRGINDDDVTLYKSSAVKSLSFY